MRIELRRLTSHQKFEWFYRECLVHPQQIGQSTDISASQMNKSLTVRYLGSELDERAFKTHYSRKNRPLLLASHLSYGKCLSIVSDYDQCTMLHWMLCLSRRLPRRELCDGVTKHFTCVCSLRSSDSQEQVCFRSTKIKFDFADTHNKTNSRRLSQFYTIDHSPEFSVWRIARDTYRSELVSDHLSDCRKSIVKCWEHNQFRTNVYELFLVKCSMPELLFTMKWMSHPLARFEFAYPLQLEIISRAVFISKFIVPTANLDDPSKNSHIRVQSFPIHILNLNWDFVSEKPCKRQTFNHETILPFTFILTCRFVSVE
jgi:hypothetical protein